MSLYYGQCLYSIEVSSLISIVLQGISFWTAILLLFAALEADRHMPMQGKRFFIPEKHEGNLSIRLPAG